MTDLIRAMTQPSQRLGVGQHSFYRAGIALLRGKLQAAHDHASQSLNMTSLLCLPFITGNCRVGLAKVLVELGERDKAQEQLTAAIENARLIGSRSTEVHCFLTTAQLLLKEGQQQEAQAALRAGLQAARELDYVTLEYWWRPR